MKTKIKKVRVIQINTTEGPEFYKVSNKKALLAAMDYIANYSETLEADDKNYVFKIVDLSMHQWRKAVQKGKEA